MRQPTLLTGSILLIAGLLIALLVYQSSPYSTVATADVWPSFTMEYREGSREITYRIDTLIPVLVVDKVEGETIYTATVEKLELR